MKLIIEAQKHDWRERELTPIYEVIHDNQLPDGCDVEVSPHLWNTTSEFKRVKLLTQDPIGTFICSAWHVHIFFACAHPKFQIISPARDAAA